MRVTEDYPVWEDSPSPWLACKLLWRRWGHGPVVGDVCWLAWTELVHRHWACRTHPCGLLVSGGWWRDIQREVELQLKV